MTHNRYVEPLQHLIKHPTDLAGIADPVEWWRLAEAIMREAQQSSGKHRLSRLNELERFCWRDASLQCVAYGLGVNHPFMDISEYLGLISEASEEQVANWPYIKKYRRDIERDIQAGLRRSQ